MKIIFSFIQRGLFFVGIAVYSLLVSNLLPIESSSLLFSLNGFMVSSCLFARYGLDKALLKEVATNKGRKFEKYIWGVAISSKKLICYLIFICFWYFNFTDFKLPLSSLFFIIISFCFNASILYSAMCKGEGSFIKAGFFENGFYFSLCAILVYILSFFIVNVDIHHIILIQFIIILFISTFIFIQVIKEQGEFFKIDKSLDYSNSDFGKISIIGNLGKFFPLLVLSMYEEVEAVSVYKVSEQIAFSSGFVLLVIGGYYSSKFARFKNESNYTSLNKSYVQSLIISFVMGFFATLFLIIIEPFIFSITNVYDKNYIICFYILLLTSFINVSAGPSFTYLTMVGRESSVKKIMINSLVVTACLLPFAMIYRSVALVAVISLITATIQNICAVILIYRDRKYEKNNI